MKKTLVLSMLPILLLTGCGEPEKPRPEDRYNQTPINIKDYEGVEKLDCFITNAGYQKDDEKTRSGIVSINLPFSTLATADTTVYNADVEKMLSLYVYSISYGKVFLKNPKTGEFDNDNTPMSYAKYIGGQDAKYYELGDVEFGKDGFDTTTFVMTHEEKTINNKKYQFVFLGINGTTGIKEWASNVDLGSYSTNYSLNMTEEHPDWKESDAHLHKGFSVTANRVYKIFNSYLERYKVNDSERTVFVCGHSRGGSIANIIGNKLDASNIRNFTYTFAGTNVSDQHSEYGKSIFNIVGKKDIVPIVVPTSMNFERFGKDMPYDIADMEDEYNAFLPFMHEYCDCEAEKLQVMINEIFGNDRDRIYQPTATTKSFDDLEEAQTFIRRFKHKFPVGSKASKFINSISNAPRYDETEEEYLIDYNYALGGLVNCMFNEMIEEGKTSIALSYVPYLNREIDYIKDHFVRIMAYLDFDGVGCAHAMETYIFKAFFYEE